MNMSAHPITLSRPEQVAIETRRLVLRQPQRSDAALLVKFAGERQIAEGTRSIPHPLPLTVAEQFINDALAPDREEDVWIIDDSKESGAPFLGVVSLKALDRSQSQVGYWIAQEHWGGGFATEAVTALLQDNPHQNKTIFAEVFKDNPASARILTNLGFEYISDAEAWSVARDCAVPTWTYLLRMA